MIVNPFIVILVRFKLIFLIIFIIIIRLTTFEQLGKMDCHKALFRYLIKVTWETWKLWKTWKTHHYMRRNIQIRHCNLSVIIDRITTVTPVLSIYHPMWLCDFEFGMQLKYCYFKMYIYNVEVGCVPHYMNRTNDLIVFFLWFYWRWSFDFRSI